MNSLLMCYQARDRLYEKRAYFGREAIKIVSIFFQADKYAGSRKAISTYAQWAGQSDGPGVWGKPTPIDCTVPEDDSDYIVCVVPF
jgi:hypothetical protein